MTVTASKLRENIYRILDDVAKTGVPVEVIRKGVKLRIVPEKKRSKLANLKKRQYWTDPNDNGVIPPWEETEGYKEWIEEWENFK